ncbi:hypothetical protein [Enterovirga sp. CN4-39]|uniref:hypothetical protein n=1 Tax=Enterovirga sp. CN4-39 TaxID=3400910 RepID=UPI003C07CAFD
MFDLLLLTAGLLAGVLATLAFLLPKLRKARATLQVIEAELAAARSERNGLTAELETARRAVEEQDAAIAAENAELRRRMDELADQILAREMPPPQAGPTPDPS